MKCPKCGYLGFESADRCRHCDYDFSLTEATPLPELPLRRAAETTKFAADLPLFDLAAAAADDTPLITKPSPPRTPLAVRRSTPELPRVRPDTPRSSAFDLSLGGPSQRASADGSDGLAADTADHDAGIVARAFAVIVDLAVLLSIDVVVIYLTMEICGISVADFNIVPKGPLAAFLLLQNMGYLIAFTAGGQTLGKMVTGIKVVAIDGSAESAADAGLGVGRAVKRTVAWLLLATPAGLGFLSALFGRQHRGLHDRFAGTRVVRASV